MICPYCRHEFPLTWARYIGAPFGKHTCPSCDQPSKFRLTAGYILVLVLMWPAIFLASTVVTIAGLAVAAVAMGLPFRQFNTFDENLVMVFIMAWLAGTWLFGMVITTVADRYYDEHYRTLEKLPRQSTLLDDDDFLEK